LHKDAPCTLVLNNLQRHSAELVLYEPQIAEVLRAGCDIAREVGGLLELRDQVKRQFSGGRRRLAWASSYINRKAGVPGFASILGPPRQA